MTASRLPARGVGNEAAARAGYRWCGRSLTTDDGPLTPGSENSSARNMEIAAATTVAFSSGFCAPLGTKSRLTPSPAKCRCNVTRSRITHCNEQCVQIDGRFSRALELNPKNATAWESRANVWIAQQEVLRALADFDQAIRLNARFSEAFHNRGLTFLLLN